MSRTKRFTNCVSNPLHQSFGENPVWLHLDEEEDRFVEVLWSSLSHADGLQNFRRKLCLEDIVYLCGAKANAGWIEDTV